MFYIIDVNVGANIGDMKCVVFNFKLDYFQNKKTRLIAKYHL